MDWKRGGFVIAFINHASGIYLDTGVAVKGAQHQQSSKNFFIGFLYGPSLAVCVLKDDYLYSMVNGLVALARPAVTAANER